DPRPVFVGVFCSRSIRPPPSTPLFPYTTLFRSRRERVRARIAEVTANASAAHAAPIRRPGHHVEKRSSSDAAASAAPKPIASPRSEEHTSELQSPYDHVCRHPLEKKKQQKQNDP